MNEREQKLRELEQQRERLEKEERLERLVAETNALMRASAKALDEKIAEQVAFERGDNISPKYTREAQAKYDRLRSAMNEVRREKRDLQAELAG